jgi:hypothetical protein
MSRFEQLRGLYKEQDDAVSEYWGELRRTVSLIKQGFGNYLELPEREYEGDDGGMVSYVKIARFENGEFIESGLHELRGENSALKFALGLAVDLSHRTYPKSTLYTNLNIKKEPGGYQIASDDSDISISIAGEIGAADFTPLYEAVFQLLKGHFQRRP